MDLDSPLQTHVNGLVKREIISSFWGVDNTDLGTSKENFELKQYFGHYTAQSDLALHDLGRYVSARTHRDIIDIIDLFKQGRGRDEIKNHLDSQNATTGFHDRHQALNASIDLAVRLFLMLEVGRIHNSFSGHKDLRWEHGSLQSFVTSHFGSPQALQGERVKFEKIFIARSLGQIAQIGAGLPTVEIVGFRGQTASTTKFEIQTAPTTIYVKTNYQPTGSLVVEQFW